LDSHTTIERRKNRKIPRRTDGTNVVQKREKGEEHGLSQTGIVKAYQLRDQRPNFELNMRKQRLHDNRTEHTVGRPRQMGRAFLLHVKFRPWLPWLQTKPDLIACNGYR